MAKETVYIVKFSNNEESFYKIGITTRFTSRLSNVKKLYPCFEVIMSNVFDDTTVALNVEKDLQLLNTKFSYVPINRFCGYLECFSQINERRCNEILFA